MHDSNLIINHKRERPTKTTYQIAGRKALDEICDVKAFEKMTPKQLIFTWNGRHKFQLQKFAHVLTAAAYRALQPRLLTHPYFVVPILRSKLGLFNVVVNHQNDLTIGLPLADYQKKGDAAAATMTIQFFPEFADSKDIVLVRGEIMDHVTPDSPHQRLMREDAAWVMNCVLRYYTFENLFERYVVPFNKNPSAFDFHAYLRQVMADAEGKIDMPTVQIEDKKFSYDPTKL